MPVYPHPQLRRQVMVLLKIVLLSLSIFLRSESFSQAKCIVVRMCFSIQA